MAAFQRQKTAEVAPDTLATLLWEAGGDGPRMERYDIADFKYEKQRFEDRPVKSALEVRKDLLAQLDLLGEDRYYSQSLVEAAWDIAFLEKFQANHRAAMGRKAPASVVQGVRYTQARSIRIMHAHYRRTIGKSSASTESDDVDDEQVQYHLNAYAAALVGNTLGTIDEAAASIGEESKAAGDTELVTSSLEELPPEAPLDGLGEDLLEGGGGDPSALALAGLPDSSENAKPGGNLASTSSFEIPAAQPSPIDEPIVAIAKANPIERRAFPFLKNLRGKKKRSRSPSPPYCRKLPSPPSSRLPLQSTSPSSTTVRVPQQEVTVMRKPGAKQVWKVPEQTVKTKGARKKPAAKTPTKDKKEAAPAGEDAPEGGGKDDSEGKKPIEKQPITELECVDGQKYRIKPMNRSKEGLVALQYKLADTNEQWKQLVQISENKAKFMKLSAKDLILKVLALIVENKTVDKDAVLEFRAAVLHQYHDGEVGPLR